MAGDNLTEFAKLFKSRENQTPASITTGIVLSPPPEVQIQLNDVIILRKQQLIFSAHMLADYKREIEIKINDTDCGQTSVSNVHSHSIETLTVDTDDAEYTTKDTIVAGDEVILMPTIDEQLYFVLDKAVRFE